MALLYACNTSIYVKCFYAFQIVFFAIIYNNIAILSLVLVRGT